ncbi:MAG: thiamine diphosphokinase [Lachnospiraceae bacterium]|nr:thiamine diphosphokinase [Lachnospiraceae bacterium]
MLGKTLLMSGGKTDLAFASEYLKCYSFDTVVCADSGLDAAHSLGLSVDYIMGDFDSVSSETLRAYQSGEIKQSKKPTFVQYPKAKDFTDTQMVLEWILEQGAEEITILGATGGRLDHFLSNLNILMKPLKQGVPAYIVDAWNRLYLIDCDATLYRDKLFGKYISFQPLTERVYPVTLKGFEYGLTDYTLVFGEGRAISNEMAEGVDEATVSFQEGVLIVIESRDVGANELSEN